MAKKINTKATVNVKDFAPKSKENFESVKAARRNYCYAVIGEKKWVSHDDFLKIVAPWDKEFGTWVAGKGLVKYVEVKVQKGAKAYTRTKAEVQKNSVSKATKVATKTKDCRVEKLEKRVNAIDKKLDAILAKLG